MPPSSESKSYATPFQADVSRLLDLMARSVYSDRRIFLRELIANASDACDQLRHRALTEPGLIKDDPEFKIQITVDSAVATLMIADNGIGMSGDEMSANLGTIARSGTREFLHKFDKNDGADATEDDPKAVEDDRETAIGEGKSGQNLIGRFGVGFYSAFMVADRVEVVSRRADADTPDHQRWISNGRDGFDMAPVDAAELGGRFPHGRGTSITLFLRRDAEDILDSGVIEEIVTRYSDHIGFPIELVEIKGGKPEQPRIINTARALWTRSKAEISEEQYHEFYRHIAGTFDDPLFTLHYRVEGRMDYSVLAFAPQQRPYDLFDPKRTSRLKLYVRRVFITDEAELLPSFLRFMRGLVDSADLPLNISREMLQNDPNTALLRQSLTKRILLELTRKAEKDTDIYLQFWGSFGEVLKEGLYESVEHRDVLLKLARFRTTTSEASDRSLDAYIAAMKPNQTAIYYLTGETASTILASPQLEGFMARGLEVLILSDPVDNFWTTAALGYDGKPFKSVLQSVDDLAVFPLADKGDSDDKDDEASDGESAHERDLATLAAAFKQALGDRISSARKSHRLTTSPVCLVAADGELDPHLERLLRMHKNYNDADHKKAPILELNPDHNLIRSLAAQVAATGYDNGLDDIAYILLEQAHILNGEAVTDAAAFARRLNGLMERTLVS